MNFLDKISNPENPDKPKSSNAFGVLLILAALSGVVGAMVLTQSYQAIRQPKENTAADQKLFNFDSKVAGITDTNNTQEKPSANEPPKEETPTQATPTKPEETQEPKTGTIDKKFTIRVANGSDTDGLAAKYAQNLKSKGFNIITTNNALTKKSKTTIYYLKGKKSQADTIAKELGSPAAALEEFNSGDISDSADIVILLGQDRTK